MVSTAGAVDSVQSAESGADSGQPRDGRIALGIGALFLLIAVPLAVTLNIWMDEAYSLLTVSKDLPFLFQHARGFEAQPPFYYLMLWVWQRIDDSIVFARLNSVLIMAATLWVVYLAARKWFKDMSPLWIFGPVAANMWVLYCATEIRTYALVLLFSALLILLFHDAFFAERGNRVAQALYALTALLSLHTYYFLGFILVAFAAVLLVERRWRRLGVYVVWMVGVGLLFVPEFLTGAGHVVDESHSSPTLPGSVRAAQFVGLRVFSLALGITTAPRPIRWGLVGLTMLVVAVCLFYARTRIPRQVRALWILTAVIAVFYFAVVRLVTGEDTSARHFLVLLLPAFFAVAPTLALLGRLRTPALSVWAVLVVVLNAVASYQEYGTLAKVGDYERAARFVEENESPGQSIIMLHTHGVFPFDLYYEGTSTIVPAPAPPNYDVYRAADWALSSPEQIRQILRGAEDAEQRVWVYIDLPTDFIWLGVDLKFEYLEDVVAREYELLADRELKGASIRLFQRKSPGVDETG